MDIYTDFREYVLRTHLSETVRFCYSCSACVSACPVALATEGTYNPRRIVQLAVMGQEDALLEHYSPNVWECTDCLTCDLVCPQSVELTGLFTVLKNMSTARGQAPKAYTSQLEAIQKSGQAIPVMSAIKNRRKKLGLPDPRTPALDEIQALMRSTAQEEPTHD
jgi:heterodisulfide reductase subunit C